jgi:hypothetical protein
MRFYCIKRDIRTLCNKYLEIYTNLGIKMTDKTKAIMNLKKNEFGKCLVKFSYENATFRPLSETLKIEILVHKAIIFAII